MAEGDISSNIFRELYRFDYFAFAVSIRKGGELAGDEARPVLSEGVLGGW